MFATYPSNPSSNFANNMYTYLPDVEEDDDVTIVKNKNIYNKENDNGTKSSHNSH